MRAVWFCCPKLGEGGAEPEERAAGEPFLRVLGPSFPVFALFFKGCEEFQYLKTGRYSPHTKTADGALGGGTFLCPVLSPG